MTDDYNIGRWPKYGRLLNGVVVPCTMMEWARMFEDFEARRIASTHIERAHISTVFLGLNHGFGNRPLWFETMVFDLVMPDESAQIQDRYETLAEAQEGHERIVWQVREQIAAMREARRAAFISEALESQTPRTAE